MSRSLEVGEKFGEKKLSSMANISKVLYLIFPYKWEAYSSLIFFNTLYIKIFSYNKNPLKDMATNQWYVSKSENQPMHYPQF